MLNQSLVVFTGIFIAAALISNEQHRARGPAACAVALAYVFLQVATVQTGITDKQLGCYLGLGLDLGT